MFGIKFVIHRTVTLTIIESFSLYTRKWYMSHVFADSLRANSQHTHYVLLCVQF